MLSGHGRSLDLISLTCGGAGVCTAWVTSMRLRIGCGATLLIVSGEDSAAGTSSP